MSDLSSSETNLGQGKKVTTKVEFEAFVASPYYSDKRQVPTYTSVNEAVEPEPTPDPDPVEPPAED